MSTLPTRLAFILSVPLIGCGSPSPEAASVSIDGVAVNAVRVASPCEEGAFPCSLADVDPAVNRRGLALLDILAARVTNVDDALVAWVREQPDVVEVNRTGRLLRFRLEGSRPFYLLQSEEDGSHFKGAGRPRSPVTPAGRDVTGQDRTQDGKVNQRDHRKALILSPYLWEFGASDEGPALDALFTASPGVPRERGLLQER